MVEQMESLLEQVEGQAILQAQAVRDYGVEHSQGVALKGERWGTGHMAMCPWKSSCVGCMLTGLTYTRPWQDERGVNLGGRRLQNERDIGIENTGVPLHFKTAEESQ